MAPAANKTSVVIVDDHETVRHRLRGLIDAQPDLAVVGEAETGAGALQRVGQGPPAVLILDLDLPDIRGFEVMRRLSRIHPSVKVLVFSSWPPDLFASRMFEAGAACYVCKSAGGAAMLEALRRIVIETDNGFSRRDGPLH